MVGFCRGIWGLLICIPLLLWAEEEAAPPFRFASQPLEGTKILHEQFHGLIGYLQMTLHRPVEMVDYTDLDRLRQAFGRGELDLAYLGPRPAALSEDADRALQPLACFREPDGEDRFTCSLVARGESRVDLASSETLRIAMPHPSSTCGGLALPEMLRQAGRRADDPGIRIETTDSDADGALGVVRGEYDLAVVKTQVAERYRHLDLRILGVSRPYPLFGLYANGRRLAPDLIERLRQGLLSLDAKGAEARRVRMDTWGEGLRNGILPPSACSTSGLREPVGGPPPVASP